MSDVLSVIDETNGPGLVKGIKGAAQTVLPARLRDVLGRMKVTTHQNIYEADFEYGTQPLRWEAYTQGAGTITHQPALGGVRMRLTTASGDITIRQSRPYHRYQPGKTMYMATAVNFGNTQANQFQRVGFFDDSNGVFFEQSLATTANPYGMYLVLRSDSGGTITNTKVSIENWNGDQAIIASLDWTRIQMLWIEYAWYGAGAIRWGIFINGEPYIMHQVGAGNGNFTGSPQIYSWSRTGNLPVRYEQRNTGVTAAVNDMVHFGVSVIVEGRTDEQRGFTYSYGMAPTAIRRAVPASTVRYPVLSFRGRTMGTQEYTQTSAAVTAGTTTSLTVAGTPWTVNQWQGRVVFFPTLGGGNGLNARIASNTTNVLTFGDIVTGLPIPNAPASGASYTIGLVNRGQLLPKRLMLSSDQICLVELISSPPVNPVTLTGATFTALASLGSAYSFAERDVSATALTGGEVVFAFTAPAGGSGLQDIDMSYFFPLCNTILGNTPDILTVAITTSTTAANVGAHIICQEAMS